MNSAAVPPLIALVLQIVLGLAVFHSNPRRKPNQSFLLLSLVIGLWLGCLYLGLSTRDRSQLEFYIRQASVAGALVLATSNLLRLSIVKEHERWRKIIAHAWPWLLAVAGITAFCQTSLFLTGAGFAQPPGSPTPLAVPRYGHGVFLYVLYFLVAGAALIVNYARDFKMATGVKRAELAFILTGAVVTLATVLLFFLLGFAINRSRLVWFAPFRVVLFSLIVAYGMATRKIMDVGFFLQRSMSYIVLAVYLLALYGLIWWLIDAVFEPLFGSSARSAAHIAASVIVAFAMAPARGVSQSLADRLFASTRGLDFRATVSKAAAILESVATVPNLLQRFATTIAEAVHTDHVAIFLAGRDTFRKSYAIESVVATVAELSFDDPLSQWLKNRREPLVVDELRRLRTTPITTALRKRLESMQVAAVLGIFARENLVGIMLLGPRESGRIYGSMEQNALQVLCGQLAVAVENAELFTEVQNARIYNETLLQNLTTGVIAVDGRGRITVFNSEAEQITGLKAADALETTTSDLPVALRTLFERTLASRERQEDQELQLKIDGGNLFARASSSIFHGQNGELLGALMVITDITALKRLEQQIRRSDRLASLGTLSAGMAHEIKNPLVSIKTFAQLLPERYHDTDFRDTFSTLIVHEIDRIDSLVNQLLRFARPAKPLLRPMHMHQVLEKTLALVQHRLYQKEIKLTRIWGANIDTIHADGDQLEQVFLNFFLNAMDAMTRGGELTIATEMRAGDALVSGLSGNGQRSLEALRVSVRDTGAGIRSEDLAHVFDPFFTTKDYGTGLGLSVVHGIIQEHGGQIEVESELARGTAFHIFLPLVRFSEEVAAA